MNTATRRTDNRAGTCDGRKSDRFGTVHDCSLRPEHGGYHETVDGLLFSTVPGPRYRRVPVASEQYLGKTGAIREIVEVIPDEAKSGLEFAPVTVRLRPGGSPVSMFPGQWAVMFDNGDVEILDRDVYEHLFRSTGER